jgi:hypothetical protein
MTTDRDRVDAATRAICERSTLSAERAEMLARIALTAADALAPLTAPARDGIEAQRGLNDVWPGDPYPVASLADIRQREVQALFAGLSRRDWHATEAAANEMRDKLDRLLIAQRRETGA